MKKEGEIKILLVDDEEDFATTLAERLRQRSYRVELASDGRQALELIAQRSFEIILLDLNMPGLHGLKVLQRIKKVAPATQVIVITGYGSQLIKSAAMLAGAYEFLRKPLDFRTLTKSIRQAGMARFQEKE
jgi:DNA-binding NtrC family response regulator